MAHAFVTGAAPSDSERDISVGGVAHVGLEHLRRRRLRRARPPARPTHADRRAFATPALRSPTRSARPTTSRAAGWSTSARAGLGARSSSSPAPVPRRLATLRGTLDDLLTRPAPRRRRRTRSSRRRSPTTAVRPHAMERLRTRFPHTLRASRSSRPAAAADRAGRDVRRRVLGRTDAEVMTNFFTDVATSAPDGRGAGPARRRPPTPVGIDEDLAS